MIRRFTPLYGSYFMCRYISEDPISSRFPGSPSLFASEGNGIFT